MPNHPASIVPAEVCNSLWSLVLSRRNRKLGSSTASENRQTYIGDWIRAVEYESFPERQCSEAASTPFAFQSIAVLSYHLVWYILRIAVIRLPFFATNPLASNGSRWPQSVGLVIVKPVHENYSAPEMIVLFRAMLLLILVKSYLCVDFHKILSTARWILKRRIEVTGFSNGTLEHKAYHIVLALSHQLNNYGFMKKKCS